MVVDLWAHRYADEPKLKNELWESDGFEDDLAAMEAEAARTDRAAAAKPADDWETVEAQDYGVGA